MQATKFPSLFCFLLKPFYFHAFCMFLLPCFFHIQLHLFLYHPCLKFLVFSVLFVLSCSQFVFKNLTPVAFQAVIFLLCSQYSCCVSHSLNLKMNTMEDSVMTSYLRDFKDMSKEDLVLQNLSYLFSVKL